MRENACKQKQHKHILGSLFHKVAAIVPNSSQPTTPCATYDQALDYLYGRINYEKIGATPYTLSYYRLDRMRKLLQYLGEPHTRYDIIHIAGTKGKGTTANLIYGGLCACGIPTGLATSPHLLRLEERIQFNGATCTPSQLVALTNSLAQAADAVEAGGAGRATFFELTTAMGLLHFANCQAAAVVLEVGLGGRLDSTNVCSPVVSVICSISLDHQSQLGDTIDAIAREKAGIIKPRTPVVCAARHPQAISAISQIAASQAAPLQLIDRDYRVHWSPLPHSRSTLRVEAREHSRSTLRVEELSPMVASRATQTPLGESCDEMNALVEYSRPPQARPDEISLQGNWHTRLLGRHQADNLAAALCTLELLRERGWNLPSEKLRHALGAIQPLARLQIVDHSPLSIIDSAHNPASMAAALQTIDDHFPDKQLTVVFAASRDKDWQQMLAQLWQRSAKLIITAYRENPRALSIDELHSAAQQLAATASPTTGPMCVVDTADSPAAAWNLARSSASYKDVILATGSFFLAAEIMSAETITELES